MNEYTIIFYDTDLPIDEWSYEHLQNKKVKQQYTTDEESLLSTWGKLYNEYEGQPYSITNTNNNNTCIVAGTMEIWDYDVLLNNAMEKALM